MQPRPFEYHAPETVAEAVDLLSRYGGEAKVLAGGQSLVTLMKLRIASPAHVIDLGRIEGLDYIRKEGQFVALGAMTRMADVETSDVTRSYSAILSECASQIADPLVRNRGTVGGNVCHADPANDLPAAMVATRAKMVAAGRGGRREIDSTEFFLDMFTTALRADEILVELRVPTRPRTGGAYVKLERQPGDFGIVGAAATMELGEDGTCSSCGVGLSGAGPVVLRAKRAEEALVGKRPGKEGIEVAAGLAEEESSPVGDLRGSEAYKRKMVIVLTRRALLLAWKRAKGGKA